MDCRGRVTPISWLGFALVVIGVGLCTGRILWSKTRNWVPLNIPILLTQGQTIRTTEFRIDIPGDYGIAIAVERKIPIEITECLMGMESFHPERCPVESEINEAWVLRNDTKIVARGNAATSSSGAYSELIMRQIGSFHGQPRQKYSLEVQVLSDGRALMAANPHLIVKIEPEIYERNLYSSLPFFIGGTVLALPGIFLIVYSVLRGRSQQRRKSYRSFERTS